MDSPAYQLGQCYLLRLPPGEDLLVGLYRVCREYDVAFGVFRVTGAVRSATLGHLDQETGKVRRRALEGSYDLVQCSGNISPLGNSSHIRAYAILGDSQGQISAGQLLAAEVHVAEVSIQELKGPAQGRVLDPEIGLWLWPVQ